MEGWMDDTGFYGFGLRGRVVGKEREDGMCGFG